MEYTISMRINFTEDQMTYIGEMADRLDISIPDLCLKALHIVDTIQLCDAQGIKAVFLEDEEQLEFIDLFDVFPSDASEEESDDPAVGADSSDTPEEEADGTDPVIPTACTGTENTEHSVRTGPVDAPVAGWDSSEDDRPGIVSRSF